jgi:hypothetical protein
MADEERLKLTARRRTNDREFRPVVVLEDPDDTNALLTHLENIVRDQDGRRDDPWWMVEYELRVQGVDREWRDFVLAGRPR